MLAKCLLVIIAALTHCHSCYSYCSEWPSKCVLPTEDFTLGHLINLAGKNRLFTQKIGKAYIMMNSGYATIEFRKEIERSVLLFDEGLIMLERHLPTNECKVALEKMKSLWNPYKTIVEQAPSSLGVKNLLESNTQLLNACDYLVKLLVAQAREEDAVSMDIKKIELAHCINISGRCRMLSQRISLYYIAHHEKYTNDKSVISESVEEVETIIDYLKSCKWLVGSIKVSLLELESKLNRIKRDDKSLIKPETTILEICDWASVFLKQAEKLTKELDEAYH